MISRTIRLAAVLATVTAMGAHAQNMKNDTKRSNDAPVGSASSPSVPPSAPVGKSGAQGADAAAPNAGKATSTNSGSVMTGGASGGASMSGSATGGGSTK